MPGNIFPETSAPETQLEDMGGETGQRVSEPTLRSLLKEILKELKENNYHLRKIRE